MDTPEASMSALHSDRIEPLPRYTANESEEVRNALILPVYTEHESEEIRILSTINSISGARPLSLTDLHTLEEGNSGKPLDKYPESRSDRGGICDPLAVIRQIVVRGFFRAIEREQQDAIAIFIDRKLVTANTTNGGKTPLLAAVATRNVGVVKQLLDYGARPNDFGVESTKFSGSLVRTTHTMRTPLQVAASAGHLPLVKLFMEVYHCDDSLIAPDGQIALRLAATNDHREVVDYLPARRGGGFLRWKAQHQIAIQRYKRALKSIYAFIKFFVWDVEKFLLWTCPKHMIVKPLMKSCNWCWENRKGFVPWCKRQVLATPERVKKAGNWIGNGVKKSGKWVWGGVKKVPKAVADAGKAVWKFGTVTLPKCLKKLGKWLWNLITTRIPRAIAIAGKWIWGGVASAGKALWNVILKLASLLHTAFSAVVTFFRELTLKDIWDGFCSFLKAIFVTFPKTLWKWIETFGDESYKFMKTILGELGECIWWIICILGYLVVYVPSKLWEVIQSMGQSFAKAWYEVLVWFRPKA